MELTASRDGLRPVRKITGTRVPSRRFFGNWTKGERNQTTAGASITVEFSDWDLDVEGNEDSIRVPFDQFMDDLRKASVEDPEIVWLAKNEQAAKSLHRGLEQSLRKKGKFIGKFTEMADEE